MKLIAILPVIAFVLSGCPQSHSEQEDAARKELQEMHDAQKKYNERMKQE